MVPQSTRSFRKRCIRCQYEADASDSAWSEVSHPPLGTLTQCPECGSTDIRNVE